MREQIKKKRDTEAVSAELDQSEQIYDLRRENFKLAADNRRLTLDNELLRSDERGKKEQTAYQEIAKLENLIEDLKSEKMSSERENSKMLAKIRQMDL